MKRPVKLCLFQFGSSSGNIFRSFYSRLTPRKTSLSECWCGCKKKFVFTIRFDMKKDKKEETMNPFIKEAWICRTGAVFQRFSVERRQVRGERESEPLARGGVKRKKKKKTTKKHLYPYAHQNRITTKNISRIVNS